MHGMTKPKIDSQRLGATSGATSGQSRRVAQGALQAAIKPGAKFSAIAAIVDEFAKAGYPGETMYEEARQSVKASRQINLPALEQLRARPTQVIG